MTEVNAARWISVTAEGEASITPDVAMVSFAVTGSGKELTATRDDVNARSSSVLAALRDLDIADADVNAPDFAIHPEYDYRKGQRLIGYRVTRQMTVRVRDLAGLGTVLDRVVASGADEVNGAQMSAADATAADHAALTAAVAAARGKADAIARASGVELGGVQRVEEEEGFGGRLMPKIGMMAMSQAADAGTQVSTGDLTVTRRIRAWFSFS